MATDIAEEPEGELVIKTLTMPRDTNANGDIFGGWLVSQMDLGGAIAAHKRANGRTVTVAIDKMTFIRPVSVGDVMCCYAKLLSVGRTSMAIQVQAWKLTQGKTEREKVTEGVFTFVAIDKNGRPVPVDPPTEGAP